MSLLQRFKNIWRLSEYEIPKLGEKTSDLPSGTNVITALFKKPQPKIISRKDLLEGII